MTTRSPDPAEIRLRERVRSLPYEEPDDGRLAELRRTVVLGAPSHRTGNGRLALLGASLAGACVAAALLTLRAPPTGHALLGHVTPLAGARLEHLVPAASPPAPWAERVRLEDGAAWFDVDLLGPGESFLVLAGDGVVEVRGTRFFCAVEGGRLVRVAVEHGKVELRVGNGPPLLLGPGEEWSPPSRGAVLVAPPPAPAPTKPMPLASRHRLPAIPPSPEPPAPAPDPVPAPAPLPAPEPELRPEERAFTAGWEALRSGDAANAASRFAQVPAGDPLGEDAAYWGLVAIGRLGGAKAPALRDFLARWPASARKGEVNLMLGLRLLSEGDRAGAREPLQQAATDPSPRLAEAARQALQSISSGAAPAGP